MLLNICTSFIFGHKYNVHLSGNNIGYISVKKDSSGIVTIEPAIEKLDGSVVLNNDICSFIPESNVIYFNKYEPSKKLITIESF